MLNTSNLNLYVIKTQKELAKLFAESVANMVSLLLWLHVLYFRFPIKVFILERKMCVCMCIYIGGDGIFERSHVFLLNILGKLLFGELEF